MERVPTEELVDVRVFTIPGSEYLGIELTVFIAAPKDTKFKGSGRMNSGTLRTFPRFRVPPRMIDVMSDRIKDAARRSRESAVLSDEE